MSVCWGSTSPAGTRKRSAKRDGRANLAPGVQEAGNLLMTVYEDARPLRGGRASMQRPAAVLRRAGRWQGAPRCLSRRRARQATGGSGSRCWTPRCDRADDPNFGLRRDLHRGSGEADKAIDHLERMVDAHSWQRRVHRASIRGCAAPRAAALPGVDPAAGGAPTASAPHTVST